MKNKLYKINEQFKEKELKKLAIERQGLIIQLENLKENYLELSDFLKLALIADNVFELSFYNDNEVIDLIKSFGLLKHTPKVFVSSTIFFQNLDIYQKQTKFSYPYELVWGFYKLYSSSVIKEKIALDLKIDLFDCVRKSSSERLDGLPFTSTPLVSVIIVSSSSSLSNLFISLSSLSILPRPFYQRTTHATY